MFARTTLSCLLLLISHTVFAYPGNGCPSVKEIKRTSGEFSWSSSAPGWTGHFAYPVRGKGHSTHVTHFAHARWIQLTNLEDSQGYFECDYRGNYQDEIIRFVQAGTLANKKPTDNHWSCQLNPNFPGAQCECSVSSELCLLEAVDNSPAPTPIYIHPEAAAGLESPGEMNHYYQDK